MLISPKQYRTKTDFTKAALSGLLDRGVQTGKISEDEARNAKRQYVKAGIQPHKPADNFQATLQNESDI